MHVYWTLAPIAGFAIGLFDSQDEAKALIDRHGLDRRDMLATPIYAARLSDQLADRLAAAGVAPDVLDRFDGSALACKALSDALRDAAHNAGQAETAAREARMRFELAGRICFFCGRVATVAGYGDGEPHLVCDRHAPEFERVADLAALGVTSTEMAYSGQRNARESALLVLDSRADCIGTT